MIEIRKLTREELFRLISEAPDAEIRNFAKFLDNRDLDPYNFFEDFGIEHFGVLSDGRPLYVGMLSKNDDGQYELWTIANSEIKEYFSMFKACKRKIHDLAVKYGKIYATMEKNMSSKNMSWTERLGFKIASQDDKTITLCIEGGV